MPLRKKLGFYFLWKGGQREESFKKNPFQAECKLIPDYGGEPPVMNRAVSRILSKTQLEPAALETGKTRTREGLHEGVDASSQVQGSQLFFCVCFILFL